MLLPAGGDVGLQPLLLTSFQVGSAAVAVVGNQGTGQLADVGLHPLQHGQQVHRVAGLITHPSRHDHLVVGVQAAWAL